MVECINGQKYIINDVFGFEAFVAPLAAGRNAYTLVDLMQGRTAIAQDKNNVVKVITPESQAVIENAALAEQVRKAARSLVDCKNAPGMSLTPSIGIPDAQLVVARAVNSAAPASRPAAAR